MFHDNKIYSGQENDVHFFLLGRATNNKQHLRAHQDLFFFNHPLDTNHVAYSGIDDACFFVFFLTVVPA